MSLGAGVDSGVDTNGPSPQFYVERGGHTRVTTQCFDEPRHWQLMTGSGLNVEVNQNELSLAIYVEIACSKGRTGLIIVLLRERLA